jgi:hypothetical protein
MFPTNAAATQQHDQRVHAWHTQVGLGREQLGDDGRDEGDAESDPDPHP